MKMQTSAGLYLAALFCQRNPEIVAGQVLIYPVLTVGRKNDFPSREQLGSGNYFLTFDAITNAEVEFFADVGVAGADGPSPLLAPDEMLARSPKSLIILAEKDPLIQEGLEFGRKLERAGVQVKTLVEKGTIHAFILFAGAISAGEKYFREVGRFVRSLSDQTSN